MRLGFAVKVLGGGGLPSHDTRRWQSAPSLAVSLGRCHDPDHIPDRQALALALATWPHELRVHADTMNPIAFEHFLTDTAAGSDFDVMLEAKAKALALLALRSTLRQRGIPASAAVG